MRIWVVFAALLLANCDRAVDASRSEAGGLILGSCIRITSPVFLVVHTEKTNQYKEVPRLTVVPPGNVLAPFSIEAFESGGVTGNQYARVVRVIRPDVTMRVRRVWLLKSFEGQTISVVAQISPTEDADITFLLQDAAMVGLLDAAAAGMPAPKRETLFLPGYVRFCDAR